MNLQPLQHESVLLSFVLKLKHITKITSVLTVCPLSIGPAYLKTQPIHTAYYVQLNYSTTPQIVLSNNVLQTLEICYKHRLSKCSPFKAETTKADFRQDSLRMVWSIIGLEGWLLQKEKERWSKELLPFILLCVVGGDYD